MRIELQKSLSNGIELTKGHPTKINRLLRDEEVLAAPSSSINLVLGQNVDMALPLGVACDGAVESVYLGLKGEHPELIEFIKNRTAILKALFEDARSKHGQDIRVMGDRIWMNTSTSNVNLPAIPRLKFTTRSASGATISKIFYRLMFGEERYIEALSLADEPVFLPDHPTLELLIGDDALRNRCKYDQIVDLGDWWKKMTGLPFVYAVWQRSSRSLPGSVKKIIYEAASLAQAKMQIDPSEYYLDTTPLDENNCEINLGDYWKKIRYRLNDQDFRSLGLFLALGRNVLNCRLEESFILKMNRWEQMGMDVKPASLTI